MFPEWIASHPAQPVIPPQLKKMYNAYGRKPGEHCRNCEYLERLHYHDNHYLKCKKSGKWTHGPGTDWRAKWEACGQWVKKLIIKKEGK